MPKHRTDTALSSAFAGDTVKVDRSPSPREVATYIKQASHEQATLASGAGLDLVAYLLTMVRNAVTDELRTMKNKGHRTLDSTKNTGGRARLNSRSGSPGFQPR